MFAKKQCALLALALLAACGGGGGGGSPATSSESGTSAIAAGDSSGAAYNISGPSTWTMDGLRYVSGGYSHQLTEESNEGPALTAVVVSTASMSGGTDANTNGAYRGSVLGFALFGAKAGTYTVAPSLNALADAVIAGNYDMIHIYSQVGTGVTTGTTRYEAISGKVRVEVDSEGKFHFFSEGSLPVEKRLEVLGGVAGAPDTMMLTINNAY